MNKEAKRNYSRRVKTRLEDNLCAELCLGENEGRKEINNT